METGSVRFVMFRAEPCCLDQRIWKVNEGVQAADRPDNLHPGAGEGKSGL